MYNNIVDFLELSTMDERDGWEVESVLDIRYSGKLYSHL